MFDLLRTHVLRLLRVPHDPEPPAGAPGSVRVFRAGKNFYKVRLLRWTLGEVGALAGIFASLVFLEKMQSAVEMARYETRPGAAMPEAKATREDSVPQPALPTDAVVPQTSSTPKAKAKSTAAAKQRTRPLARVAERWPPWVFPLLTLLELMGVALYIVQIPFTYAMVRLDYELRWYIVTDRSLRIRSGLARVQESTMSFANVQQVVVTQGPLQRLLGIANVRVQSAGGGGNAEELKGGDSLHTGVFHGVDNAHEIRDLILARLRQFRMTGLGDPDEAPARHESVGSEDTAGPQQSLAAAHELLREVRALRGVVS
jgi:membrane protein YdbS with pleckstrin-like domain